MLSRININWQIWAALALSLATFFSWPLLFVRWPATRDVPWANLLLLSGAVVSGIIGVRRGFAPGPHRAIRIIVSCLAASLGTIALAQFVLMVLIAPRMVPTSGGAPKVGERAPEFALLDADGRSVSLSSLLSSPVTDQRRPKGVLLIFYMYSGCRACNSEFRGIQQNLETLETMGVRPVAISVDPPAASRRLSDEAGYSFTFLSDPGLAVSRRYDLAMPNGEARPAEFLIDSSGVVRWRNLTGNYYVRARPKALLEAAALISR
jgi:peroxiredoxin